MRSNKSHFFDLDITSVSNRSYDDLAGAIALAADYEAEFIIWMYDVIAAMIDRGYADDWYTAKTPRELALNVIKLHNIYKR